MGYLKRFGIDGYMQLLVLMVILGALLPARGIAEPVVSFATYWAVGLLFFVYGAKLDPSALKAGLLNWRLQGVTLIATFVMYPILGIAFATVFGPFLGTALATGVLFLSLLPSTVQSSIAFTSIASGNVPAAICAASLSNMLGVVITPLLVSLVMHQSGGGVSGGALLKIGEQIILPFILGQILRPYIGDFIRRHKILTMVVDRGSILLIVYSAFSNGTKEGLWGQIPPASMAALFGVVVIFLAVSFSILTVMGRVMKLPRADAIAFLFCGGKKSLASGLPIATAIFPADALGAIILPTMIYHISQLLLCSLISQRMARRNAQVALAEQA